MKWRYIFFAISCLFFMTELQAQTIFRGKIIDATTKKPITNATVGISSQGIGVRSSQTGSFLYRKYEQVLKNSDVVLISAKGYEPLEIDAAQLRGLRSSFSTFSLEKAKPIKKAERKTATVYWDISSQMSDRDIDAELQIMESFIKNKGIEMIAIIPFNNKIIEEKKFSTGSSTVQALKKYLGSFSYGGISNYDLISNVNKDLAILSTNGQGILGTPTITSQNPVYLLQSSSTVNQDWFTALSEYTEGGILKARETQNKDEGKLLRGKVLGPNGPLQEVTINIKGSFEEYKTKGDGSFDISAVSGDILIFNYLGMYPKSQKIEETNTEMVVEMVSQNELLDEVIVSGKSKSKDDEETIITAFGEEKKDQIGYSVNNITSEEITPNMIYLSDVLRGRFAGVSVIGFGDTATFLIRGAASTLGGAGGGTGPIWVVDNNIYTEVPNFVPVQDIQSVSVLKSASASNRYGSVAVDGAFVITTNRSQSNTPANYRDPLVKGNDYTENLSMLNRNTNSIPDAYKDMASTKTIEEQFEVYKNNINKGDYDLEFLVDSALYFTRLDVDKGDQIINDLTAAGRNNTKILRLSAYLHELSANYEAALPIYKRIVKLDPSLSQSYRDLAKSYVSVGEYNTALELYINVLGEQIVGVDFSGLENTLRRELRHLITLYKDKIDFERLPNEWLDPSFKMDLRIVLEWSDAQVPFEFQFVNPEKKYFNWSHTLENSKERLFNEQDQGFALEEFVIDDAQSGEWLINVRFLGDAGDYVLPPFLKYTVYKNYGTLEETSEVRIIKLFNQTDKVTVGKIRV